MTERAFTGHGSRQAQATQDPSFIRDLGASIADPAHAYLLAAHTDLSRARSAAPPTPQPYLTRAKIGAKQKEGRALVPLSALPQFSPPEGYAGTLGAYAYEYAYVYT